jgi:hypothetical protein
MSCGTSRVSCRPNEEDEEGEDEEEEKNTLSMPSESDQARHPRVAREGGRRGGACLLFLEHVQQIPELRSRAKGAQHPVVLFLQPPPTRRRRRW